MNKWYILLPVLFLYACEPKPHRLTMADLQFPDPELEYMTRHRVKTIVGIDTAIAREYAVPVDKAFDTGFAHLLAHYYVRDYREYSAAGRLILRTNYLDCPLCIGTRNDELTITYDSCGHVTAEKGYNYRNDYAWAYQLVAYGSYYRLDKRRTREQGMGFDVAGPVTSYFFDVHGRLLMDSSDYGLRSSTRYRYGADGRLTGKYSVRHQQYGKEFDLRIPKAHNTRYYYTNAILDYAIIDHIYSNGLSYQDRYYYDANGIIRSASVSAPYELDKYGKTTTAPFAYRMVYRYQTY